MKAITHARYGNTDTLTFDDIATPAPGDDQVVVAVDAAGLDMGVWHRMSGLPYLARTDSGLRRPRGSVLGSDFAGRVTAVGSAVVGVAIGDEVFGTADGTFAEHAITTPDRIAPRPRTLSAAEAASTPTRRPRPSDGAPDDRGDGYGKRRENVEGERRPRASEERFGDKPRFNTKGPAGTGHKYGDRDKGAGHKHKPAKPREH